MKFITSDADAAVDLSQEDAMELFAGEPVPVTNMLAHKELFDSYPGLARTTVLVDKNLPLDGASYNERANILSVGSHVVGALRMGKPSAKAVVLHELQHGIQGVEDFARGGNTEQFLTKEGRGAVAKAEYYEKKLNDLVPQMEELYPTIPYEKSRTAVRRAMNQHRDGIISAEEAIEVMTGELDGKQGLTKEVADWVDQAVNGSKSLAEAQPRRRAAEDEAYQKYLSLRGEQEARFVQKNADKKLEDLPLTPLDDAEYQGETRVSKKLGDVRNGEALAVSLDDMKKAMADMYKPVKKSAVGKIITGLVDYTGGLGRELGAMRENADGSAALYSHRAMNAYANIEQQFKNMAKRGVKEGRYKTVEEGQKAIRADVEKKLDAIAKLPNPTRRESALAAMVRENPYYAPIGQAYSQIDQLTKTLVGQMIANNPNPTEEELKKMSTLRNNSFGYTTRMYAAFQGPEGRAHSKKILKEYNAVKDALAKGREIPEKFRESFQTVAGAMNYVIENDLNIPDTDGLWQLDSENVAKLYDTWIGSSARTKSNAIAAGKADGMTDAEAREYADEVMIQELDAFKKPTPEEYQEKADHIVNGMLGLEESSGPIAQYYRGFRQDRSILERRERVPEEIKKLFGEITDPATRLSVTIAKQGELAARTKLLLDMREKGGGKWVVPKQEAGVGKNKDFTYSLDGETYGPLNGYNTTPEIANAISENLEMFTSLQDAIAKSFINATKAGEGIAGKAFRGVQKAAAAQKMLSIIAEPFGTAMNALGSPVMLMANGVTDPKVIRDAIRTGGQSVMDTMFSGRGELSPDLEDAIKYGILDSARVQEIRRSPQKFVKGLVTASPTVNTAKRRAGVVKNTATEVFAMSDAWVKVAAFKDRANTLAKFYEAEGIKKTPEQIKEEAADTIKDTNITYGRTAPGVRIAESTGFTTFLPYFVSVPRSLAYNTIVAYKDFIRAKDAKTPAGRLALGMAAVKRLAGTSAATAGVVAGTKALAAFLNGDDDDKMKEAKKVMRADARFGDSVYLGKDSKDNPLFFRLSRIDPYGPVNDMFRILLDDSVTTEQATKLVGQNLQDLLFTNRLVSSVASLGANMITDEKIKDNETKLERIAPKATQKAKDMMLALGADYSTANSFLKVVDTMTPGWLDSIDPSNPKVQDAKDGWHEALGDFVRWSGGRVDKADPGSYAFQVGQDIKTAKDTGRKRISDSLKADYSDEDMLNVVRQADNDLFNARSKAVDLYEGMTKGLDMSPSAAKALLKDQASMTATDIAAVSRGRTVESDEIAGILSKSSLDMRAKNQESRQTKEEIEADKKKRKDFLKKMRAAGYKVGE
jgi:hypothetical protein